VGDQFSFDGGKLVKRSTIKRAEFLQRTQYTFLLNGHLEYRQQTIGLLTVNFKQAEINIDFKM